MASSTISDSCNIDYGTRVVRSRDQGDRFDVYGGGGKTFKINGWNREDSMIVSRFGMSPQAVRFVSGKFFLNDSGLTVSTKNASILDQAYLDWFLLFSNDYIFSLGRGSAQRNLDVKAFISTIVNYPESIKEQRRIIAKLDEAFKKIEQVINLTKHNIENTKAFAYATARDLLSSAQGENTVVGNILSLEYGKPLDKAERSHDGSFAAYGANGVKDRTNKFYWDQPSIIVGRKGSAGELTRVNKPFWPLDVTYYVVHNPAKTNLDYLYSLLKSLDLPSFARGVKPGINRNDIYSLDVTLPSLDDQVKIATKIDAIEDNSRRIIELYSHKLKFLNDLKQSMMTEAFSESAVK